MTLLKQNEWLFMNELIFLIYAISDTRKMRKLFLDNLSLLVSYDSALFDLGTKNKKNPLFFDPISVNIKEEYLKNYYEYYQHIDYTRWIFSQSNPIVYRDTDLLDAKLREDTEYFKNWMCPTDNYFGIGSTIISNGILLGSVTLFRSEAQENFSEKDLFILDILNSHLSNKLFQIYPRGIKDKDNIMEQSNSLRNKYNLTDREAEVIQLVSKGLSNQEISETLFITEITVKKHLTNIFKKTNVNSRTQLIKLIYLNNL